MSINNNKYKYFLKNQEFQINEGDSYIYMKFFIR